MPEVSSYVEGTPSWVDLTTPDREATTRFYGEVLGWDFQVGPAEMNHYTMCTVRGRPAAGVNPQAEDDDSPVAWTVYLSVDEIDGAVERIGKAGGSVFFGPIDVMDQGRMAVAADPTGATFGLWQPGAHRGAEVVNEPGALTWEDCLSTDPGAAREFYASVFGYTYEPLPEGGPDYTMVKVRDRIIGGLSALPGSMPSHWLAYFGVSDADEAVEAVRRGGGAVVEEPFDTPYGRMAVCRDPHGAVFSVVAMPAEQDQPAEAAQGAGG